MILRFLSLSDVIVDPIYSPHVVERFKGLDLIISCGDLPYYYLDYVISNLNVPLYFVRGNHAKAVEYTESGPRRAPQGGVNLHRKCLRHGPLLLAGVEGSVRYNRGNFQYTQSEMWGHVLALLPRLFLNRIIHGRFLDIFVSHAPPWRINDQRDHVHQGIKAFRWLLQVFSPQIHLHGHVHLYRPEITRQTNFAGTQVINTYGYREQTISIERG